MKLSNDNEQLQTTKEQKEIQRIELYKKLVNIFFLIANPITIILFLIILGYFKFAT